ncbi:MAG: ATP-dependent zinc metalloprotease FtsH [Candidatus Eremiobacterota bacterium]
MFKNLAFWVILIIGAICAYSVLSNINKSQQQINYSDFMEIVKKGEVDKVEIYFTKNELLGTKKKNNETFRTIIPQEDPSLIPVLTENGVKIEYKESVDNRWWVTIFSIFPYILLFLFFLLILRQAQAGGSQAFSFGRSRAKIVDDKRPKVTFKDVAGIDEAVEEVQEVVEFLKYPQKFQALGARIPKGVLLLGPPGSGKTLLGRAIAGESGVPFYYISGSDFVEMFVGVGASRVRDLFEQAKRSSPCIVFIDEIDAVGRQRGAGLGGGHDEREQTLNQLLVEMDGFEPNTGVILLAATNRPDVLDPALLRPGRFDRQVVVDKPDLQGRRDILEVHSRGKPFASDVDLDIISRSTSGFCGADLENLLNEAALLAARLDKKAIEMEDLEEAIERVIAGPERKSRVIIDREKLILAYHEGGHALVAKLIPDTDPVHKVTILPRGMALGYTLHLPEEDRHIVTKSELLARMTVALGGRIAEELQFNEMSTGAADDLKKVTEIAHKMVCEYGMSKELGPRTLGKKQKQVFLGRDIYEDRNYSEDIAKKIDEEIKNIVEERYKIARAVIENNMDKLKTIVSILIDKEVIDKEELDNIVPGITQVVSAEEDKDLEPIQKSYL